MTTQTAELWTIRIGEVRFDWTGTEAEARKHAAEWNILCPGHVAVPCATWSRG